jgi:hypothetical protein
MNEYAVELVAPTRLSVSGVITENDNLPVARAVVSLADMGGRKIGSAYSDHEGHYRLDTTTGGTYLLIASAPGHEPVAALVGIGDQPVSHNLTLAAAGGLLGTVTLVGTAIAPGSSPFPSGEPVSGATVTVSDVRGEVLGAGGTGEDGSFSFPNLPEGTYTLVVTAVGYQPVAASVAVGRGEPTRHEVEIAATGSLHGAVGVHGTPFEGAGMSLLDKAGRVVADTSTDASGEFVFTDLEPGEYTLVTTGYSPAAVSVGVVDGGPARADITVGRDAR